MQNSSSETYRLVSCSLKQVVAFTTSLVPATLMLHSFPQSRALTATLTLMEGSGRSSREGSMVQWTSIATGPTMSMGLEIRTGSSGMDWTTSTASPQTMMWNGTKPSIVWTYQLFRVGGADTNYLLTIGQGQGVGNSHDSMAHQNGHPFSTRDRDNDAWDRNCAAVYGGAWWYNGCFHSNLNGGYEYHTPEDGAGSPVPPANRLVWYDGAQWAHFTRVEMKVRPKRCVAATCN